MKGGGGKEDDQLEGGEPLVENKYFRFDGSAISLEYTW